MTYLSDRQACSGKRDPRALSGALRSRRVRGARPPFDSSVAARLAWCRFAYAQGGLPAEVKTPLPLNLPLHRHAKLLSTLGNPPYGGLETGTLIAWPSSAVRRMNWKSLSLPTGSQAWRPACRRHGRASLRLGLGGLHPYRPLGYCRLRQCTLGSRALLRRMLLPDQGTDQLAVLGGECTTGDDQIHLFGFFLMAHVSSS